MNDDRVLRLMVLVGTAILFALVLATIPWLLGFVSHLFWDVLLQGWEAGG